MWRLPAPVRAIPEALRTSLDSFASLLFPAPCLLCEETLLSATRLPVCRNCLSEMKPLCGPLCGICGRPFISSVVTDVAQPLCHLCRRGVYSFDFARSFAAYHERMVRAIVQLKYNSVTPLGDWFASNLANLMAAEPGRWAADVIVPVPLHSARLRERGYNQADLIAKPLARRLGLPLRSYLLVRTRPRPDRLKLTRRQRWQTVHGAYQMRSDAEVDNLRVLLVDDVFTTGATLDACARALLKGGAKKVMALTVARVVSDWTPSARPESRSAA